MHVEFNKESKRLIAEGKKVCFCGSRICGDPRVEWVVKGSIRNITEYLWDKLGFDSKEKFKEVWLKKFGEYKLDQIAYVHFGDFREKGPKSE